MYSQVEYNVFSGRIRYFLLQKTTTFYLLSTTTSLTRILSGCKYTKKEIIQTNNLPKIEKSKEIIWPNSKKSKEIIKITFLFRGVTGDAGGGYAA